MKKDIGEQIIVEYKMTGDLEVKIDEVVKRWNYLWWLKEWRDDTGSKWRLIKYCKINSGSTDLKFSISNEQAKELIQKLNLVESWCGIFNSGYSWRKESDMEIIETWRKKRHEKSQKKIKTLVKFDI